jgi:glycosyltransferase involved in cell wall biosynthesis
VSDKKRRILVVNWRDIEHPEAGGAEVHIFEIFKRVAAWGNEVCYLTSSFPGCSATAWIDGIEVIRRGQWFNANYVLPVYYRQHLADRQFDLIVEDVNKIPFFFPLVAKSPVAAVIPHLFGATVFSETNPIFATYVYLFEQFVPAVYRSCRFLAISDSTKEDLIARGIRSDRIGVVPCGIDHNTYRPGGGNRSPTPLIVYLGRLRKYKGVQYLIRSFEPLARDFPDCRLTVVGDGPYRGALEELTRGLGLQDRVTFTGFVSQQEKTDILHKAWVAASPSPKEGWGLTVIEANACGVPVVASDSPGLRDSVNAGVNGLLVRHKDTGELEAALRKIITDPELRGRLSAGAVEWAGTFTWERCATESYAFLSAGLEESGRDAVDNR